MRLLSPRLMSAASSTRWGCIHNRRLQTIRRASTEAETLSRPVSQWPLTIAVSLLAFVIGLGVESERNKVPSTQPRHHVSREEWKQSLKELQETLVSSFNSSQGAEQQSKLAEGAGSAENDERSAAKDVKKEDEDAVPPLPELDPEDSTGWREFAKSVLDMLGSKQNSIDDLKQMLSSAKEERDDFGRKQYWHEIDSQRNAEIALEYLVQADQNNHLIVDDDILRVHPWEPREGLFEPESRPTILRVLGDDHLTRCLIVNLEGPVPSEDQDQNIEQWRYLVQWFDDIVRDLQKTGQICPKSFWNFFWSRGWYKCGYPAYKIPERDPQMVGNAINIVKTKITSHL